MNKKEFYYIESNAQYIRLTDIKGFKIVDHVVYQVCTIKLSGNEYVHTEPWHFAALEEIFKSQYNGAA